jgi:hypothetical protein
MIQKKINAICVTHLEEIMKNKVLLFILFFSIMMVASVDSAPQSTNSNCPTDNTAVQTIFDNTVWWINKAPGPICQFPMAVYVDGVSQGTTYLLEFGHRNGNMWPEIAAIYNTGYLRLFPPGLPPGTSFVLGPGYWGNDAIYVHNVQISRIEINTTNATPAGAIELRIYARDYSDSRWPDYRLEITYNATLSDPTANGTQMMVTENFSVVNAFSLSSARQANHEGFKWVQLSSMYINSFQHDSDSAVYVDLNENIHFSRFSDILCGHLVFNSPKRLSSSNPWIEALHSDDFGWQGNTPNTIILVNSPSLVGQTSPQGSIKCTSDPSDDNVGMWLNHDSAPLTFNTGNTGSITYTLIAQDDPREPPLAFGDVPVEYWAWDFVERLYKAGITGGCGTNPPRYCPDTTVTRAQMAVFLERGIHGSSYNPPAVGDNSGFLDVPVSYWSAAWIKQLATDAITGGCGSGRYCPESPVTRAQMAIFLLRSRHGPSYNPPAVGASTGFGDVQPNYWAAAWIKQLVAEGITAGCGTGAYCPESPVTRAQMAVFLVRTFNLP